MKSPNNKKLLHQMTEHPVNILGAQHSGQWFRQWGALLKLMVSRGQTFIQQ